MYFFIVPEENDDSADHGVSDLDVEVDLGILAVLLELGGVGRFGGGSLRGSLSLFRRFFSLFAP